MGFNHNIMTEADIQRWLDPDAKNPLTLTDNPPGGLVAPRAATAPANVAAGAPAAGAPAIATSGAAPGGSGTGQAPGGVNVPTEDSYLTKLVKYVPIEVLGAYLLIASVVDSNVTRPHDKAIWLGALLVGFLVITAVYDNRVLSIVRWRQIAVSVVGLAVYVFAAGGWFATTTWYHPWYASVVVPAFGLLVAIFKLKPLPPDPNG
jgi:hypothetical protein